MHNLTWFYPVGHEEHREPGHPERPERIENIKLAMQQAGWWEPFRKLEAVELTSEFVLEVHTRRYLNVLEQACNQGAHLDPDTYTTKSSWQIALNSAGGLIALVEEIWKGKDLATHERKIRGFALTRPPGHHAERDRGMGFCLLNNAALAVQYLLSNPVQRTENARKVAIIDIDLHHGNGTQDIFWKRDDVLYISTHQSPLYPGTGRLEEIGEGPGEGYTVNLPLPPGTGDEGFQVIVNEIIQPVLDRYQPEFLLISAGFDAHWRDPLGHLGLSAGGYGKMIASLTEWADCHANGRIVLTLEGGYDLDAIRSCSLASVAALLDFPFHDTIGPSPRTAGKSWQPVLKKAKEIWQL